MASFATVAELGAYLNTTLDGTAATQAQSFLDQATSEMQAVMRQDIFEDTETVLLDATNQLVILLPQFPVSAISAVTVAGTVLSLPGDVVLYEDGRVERSDGERWGTKPQSVSVTYTHGYAVVPDDLKNVCKARAARLMQGPTPVKSETIGNYSVSYAETVPAETFEPGELAVMGAYTDVVVA